MSEFCSKRPRLVPSHPPLTPEERRNATAPTVIIPFSEHYQFPVHEPVNERVEPDSSPMVAQEAGLFLRSIKELMVWRNGVQEDVMCIAKRHVSSLPLGLSYLRLTAIGKYEENRLGRHALVYITERDSGKAGKETVRRSSVFVWAKGQQLCGATHTTMWIAEDNSTKVDRDDLTLFMAKTSFNLLKRSICSDWTPGPDGMGDMTPDELAMGMTTLGLVGAS